MATPKAKPDVPPRRKRANPVARPKESAGSKILAAIEEATEILRTEGLESSRITVRTYKTAPLPAATSPRTSSGFENCSGPARRFSRVSSVSTSIQCDLGNRENASRNRSPIAF